MKRLLVVLAFMMFFVGGVPALVFFWNYFSDYVSSQDSLRVEMPSPQELPLGGKTVFNLRGTGFSKDITASLILDVNSHGAIVGSLPLEGVYNKSLLSGDYLYLANTYGGLKVLDVSNPLQPELLREYQNGRSIFDIYRHDGYLYLCCGKSGVSILRIRQDGTLQHVSDIAVKNRAISCRILDGSLFVAEGEGGLSVYDVQDPAQARLMNTLMSESFVANVAIFEDLLYLLVDAKRIEIYQPAELRTLQLVGSVQPSEKIFDFAVHQQHLYIAGEAGVSLYDLDKPRKPEFLQQWVDFGSARKLFPGAEQIYVSDNFSGLRSIVAGAMESSAYISLNINPRTISETTNYLYIAGTNRGLLVVDKRKLSLQQAIPTINTSGSVQDLFISKNRLYIADGRGGVLLKNLDAESEEVTTVSSRWGKSFVVKNNLLFVAQGKQGIEVLDISDPGDPQSVAVWDHCSSLRLAVSKNYLLSSNGVSGLNVIDISDVQHPVIKKGLADVHILDVAAENGLIYVASKNEGLIIYERVENGKLNRIGQIQTPFPANQFDYAAAVDVKGDFAYVANGRSGLLIIAVKNPRKPRIISSIDIPGICKGIRLQGDKAFVSSHRGGISVVDIANPEKPHLVSNIFLSGLSRGLQVVDDIIYVAQRDRGVVAVPAPVVAEKVKIVSAEQMQVTLPSPTKPGRYSLQIGSLRESVVKAGVVNYQ